MLSLVSDEIENYAQKNTTKLPGYLLELIEETYKSCNSPQMISGQIEGSLLQFIVWTTNAKNVLDIGTFTGFSAQMMASALPDYGKVITCEINTKHAKIAKKYFDKSPHGHKIELILGPAIDTIKNLSDQFDVIFIDADKSSYKDYYDIALNLISDRGLIVIDNVLWGGKVLNPIDKTDHNINNFNTYVSNDKRVEQVILPIRDGVMLVKKSANIT